MFILYRLTFPWGPVMKRVLQLEPNQLAWAEWAWMNPAGLPSRAVYSVWTDFLYPCSFSILFWERQRRLLVSKEVWKQTRKSSPSPGSQQLLTNCTRQKNKEPKPSSVEDDAENPIGSKGNWVSEWGFQTSHPSVNTKNRVETSKLCYWARIRNSEDPC